MGIIICIGMLALGAILSLAVDVDVQGINLDVAGVILMAVGLLGLSAYVSIFKRRRMQPPGPAAPVIEDSPRRRWE